MCPLEKLLWLIYIRNLQQNVTWLYGFFFCGWTSSFCCPKTGDLIMFSLWLPFQNNEENRENWCANGEAVVKIWCIIFAVVLFFNGAFVNHFQYYNNTCTSFFLSLFMNELVQQKAVYIILFSVMVVREIKYHWMKSVQSWRKVDLNS